MIPLLALAIVLCARIHWMAGLFGALAWGAVTLRPSVPTKLPSGWWTLPGALISLVAAASLSPHPLGLPWIGILQWIALGAMLLCFRDVAKRPDGTLALVLWAVLGVATMDTLVWCGQVLTDHLDWWRVRTGDLPVFPFRLRLFGSHGSTQAAAWLGFAILLGRSWALQRIPWVSLRVAAWAWLVLQTIALSFCDSRLGWGGFAVGALLAGRGNRPDVPLLALLAIQGAVWLGRDLLHPSSIVTGGGLRSGIWMLAVSLLLLAGGAASRLLPSRPFRSLLAPAWFLFGVFVGTLPLLLAFRQDRAWVDWTTGRTSFWNEAYAIIAERPLFGGGAWSYPWFHAQEKDWTQAFLPMHPHNWILEILVSGGIASFAMAAFLVPRILRSTWRPNPGAKVGWLPLLGHWSLSMLFDSPLSSPQFLLVTALIWGGGWSTLGESRMVRLPRILWLLPALLLVPLSQLAQLSVNGALLTSIGDRGLKGDWRAAARDLLARSHDLLSGPQSERAILQSRTILSEQEPDQLRELLLGWDSLTRIEPGNLSNRIHRDWVAWKGFGDEANHARFLRRCDTLRRTWRRDLPRPNPRAGVEYPSDELSWWMEEFLLARQRKQWSRARWCARWIRERAQPGSLEGFCVERALSWRPIIPRIAFGKESAVYGISGTRWFFTPRVLEDVAQEVCGF